MAIDLAADLRRIRALCVSLSSIINSLFGLEDNGAALASCVFLVKEMRDQIDETEAKFLSSRLPK
jgi:hypothetical protein